MQKSRFFTRLFYPLFWSLLGITLLMAASPASPQAANILGKLLKNNQDFQKTHKHSFFASIQEAQHPSVTLLSCSDSRAHSTSFVRDPIDTVFSIRNIGNQIHNNFGSVDYGIYHLHTPLLLILGHSHCGAVHAALKHYASESFAIVREVDHLSIPLRDILPQVQKTQDFEKLWSLGVERNVDYQVATAMRRYAEEVQAGRLTIVGAVYDFTNAYQAGEGQLVITNLNGETDPQKLKQHRLLTQVSSELLEQAIHRH
jgi:carbonic anhydrase